jgi:hypothetical protein
LPRTWGTRCLIAGKRALRLGVFLFAAAIVAIAQTPKHAIAAGVPTHLPTTPFMSNSGDNRFIFWESLGQIKISEKITFEIPLGFTPIPNYQNSRILGSGWKFPLFESTFLQTGSDSYEMVFPTGHREHLSKAKVPDQLKGGRGRNWTATINKRNVVAKSSDNWTLVYQSGSLQKLTTPDGVNVEFNRSAKGEYSLTANKTVLLSLKPDYDTNTQKFYHLNLRGGKHAILRMGTRPVLVTTLEKDAFGRPKEKINNTETLTSVQWDGEPERKYGFNQNEMTVDGMLYKWGTGAKLIQNGKIQYEYPRIRGIECIKMIYEDKSSSVFGYDKKRAIGISQAPNEPLLITEYMNRPRTGLNIRRVLWVDDSGKENIRFQYWYDENMKIKRMLTNIQGKSILYRIEPDSESAEDENTKKIIWKKEYDKKHRLINVIAGEKIYKFEYPENEKNVRMTRIVQGNAEKVMLSPEKITSFFQIPNHQ